VTTEEEALETILAHVQGITRRLMVLEAAAEEEAAGTTTSTDPALRLHVESLGRGMDELHTDIGAARKETADLSKRVNTLARHMVGISKQVGYSFPQSGG
jgi:hypothetical protein